MNPTFGQRGDAVKAYQRKLNEQNQGKAGFTPLVVDGIFGAKTQAASNFQIPTTTPLPSSVSTKATFQDLASARPVVGDLNTQPVPPVDTTTPKSYAEIVLAQQQQQSTAQQNQDKTFEQILKDMTSLETKGADTAAALESSGFNTSRKVAQDLANQILANTAGAQADKLAIGGNVGGITTADRQGFESKIERERAIKNLNLTAQLQAAQGNMTLAKETADAAINAKYAPIETRLANLKEFYTLNKDNLDREQQKQTTLLNARMKDLEEKKDFEKYLSDLTLTATASGAPKDVIDAASKAKTKLEAAQILGKYSPETLKYELLKEQIKTEKAQRAQIDANIKKIKGETGTTSVKPLSGDAAKIVSIAGTLPTDIQKIKDKIESVGYEKFLKGYLVGTDRETVKLINSAADKIGRLRSGGAINKDEEKRFTSQFASAGDYAFGNVNSAINALDAIINEANIVGDSVDPKGIYRQQSSTVNTAPNKFNQSLGQDTQTNTPAYSTAGMSVLPNGDLSWSLPSEPVKTNSFITGNKQKIK